MEYLPLFFSVKGRACLVVGGGTVARRKITLLQKAGADITVVAPSIEPTLREMGEAGQLRLVQEAFQPGHMEGMHLVISATEKREVNREVAAEAGRRRVPINVVDDPELCTVILPAIVDRDPVVVAVSTGGNSPVLARLIKARLESLVPVNYGRLGALAGELRDRVKATIGGAEERRKFWERHFQGEAGRLFLAGQEAEGRALIEAELAAGSGGLAAPGRVSFIHGGVDDPELITLKALRTLQEADVLVYDQGVDIRVIEMARRDAERIMVGAQAGLLCVAPAEAPAHVAGLAGAGAHVVRLCMAPPAQKNAETGALDAAGVPWQMLRGVDRT